MVFKPTTNKIMAEALVKQGLLTQAEADKYLGGALAARQNLQSYLNANDILDGRVMLDALARHFRLEIVDIKKTSVDKRVIERVPVRFANYYQFVPIKIEGVRLTIAVSAPLDIRIQDELRVHLGLEPHSVLASEDDVQDALKKYYGLGSDTIDRILTKEPEKKKTLESEEAWVEDIEKQSDDPSVAKLVNQIIFEAYQKRATDIHIEPYRSKVRLRYRIDGVLVDANLPPEAKHFLLPMLSRIKIMSNLSITEKRVPQDGSAVVRTKDQDLDLRVSTIPTMRGESMVIRILPTKTMLMSLENLGFNKGNAGKFREIIRRPHGIIFVTGPTGSGKTTSLYACLNEINSPGRKIIAIEDPIEYEMEGITQIQVNAKVDLDFAKNLRSVLRHDPDIIMVGEVRDLETAEIAIRTALTGHLVFSTLHTNDAASGVTRLVDMGVEPYLVASSVEAFVAQRLVRVICEYCKQEDSSITQDLRNEIATSMQLPDPSKIVIYRGRGCDHCNNTGYFGRTAIYEIMELNEEIRSVILEKGRAEEIKAIAIKHGMTTLRQDGWKNVLEGVTTPAEVMNVTVKENWNKIRPIAEEKESKESTRFKKVEPVAELKQAVENSNNEKIRKQPRMNIQVPLFYTMTEKEADRPDFLKPTGKEHNALTSDLSGSGLSFPCKDFIEPGSVLEIKLDLEEDKHFVKCMAKVCRVRRDPNSGMYIAAVYYLDISHIDRHRIHEFIVKKMAAGQLT